MFLNRTVKFPEIRPPALDTPVLKINAGVRPPEETHRIRQFMAAFRLTPRTRATGGMSVYVVWDKWASGGEIAL
jgi:hypothetical protein